MVVPYPLIINVNGGIYVVYDAGLSFKIDEIVQAWNEMYDAKKLKNGSSSFRLEPLFRRRPSKLHNILEHIQIS